MKNTFEKKMTVNFAQTKKTSKPWVLVAYNDQRGRENNETEESRLVSFLTLENLTRSIAVLSDGGNGRMYNNYIIVSNLSG